MSGTSLLPLLRAVALCMAACAHTPPPGTPSQPVRAESDVRSCEVPDATSPADHIVQHGTLLERYRLQDGVWLEHVPILVNREFDFALVMALDDGTGAGLAAANRRKQNAERAASLSKLRLRQEAVAKLAALRCQGVYAYFLLWEGKTPSLSLVVDVPAEKAKSRLLAGDVLAPLETAAWQLLLQLETPPKAANDS